MVGDENDLIAKAKAGDLFAKNEMIRRYMPMIRIKVRGYSKAPIPSAALEGEAMRLLLYTIEKYDPAQDVQFKTYLEHNLRGLYRYTARHKNIARIPEHQVLQITRFNHVKSILKSEKNRDPTIEELSDSLGWSPTQVQRMETSIGRRDIAMSGIETLHEHERLNERMEDLLEFEYFGMDPQEKLVYDYSLGRHGRPRIADVKDIAKRTGLTVDKVYEIKRRVAQRVAARL